MPHFTPHTPTSPHAPKKIDMLQGPILPGLIAFALPLIATNILQLLFNAADIIVIGRFGSPHALASVGVGGSVGATATNVILSLNVGAAVAAGISLGARNTRQLRNIVHASMALALLVGLLLMAVMWFLAKPLLHCLNTPAEILPDAYRYICYFLPSIPPCTVYNFGAALLRAKGDTRRPFAILTISGTANVLLNLFFVLVLKLDVAGVALATSISFYLSMAMLLWLLTRERDDFRLDLRQLTLRSKAIPQILKLGITNSFQSMMFHIANLAIQGAVNSFGPVVIAGNAASGNIGTFLWTSMNGFAHASMSYTAQNTGAKNYRRICQTLWRGILAATAVGLVGAAVCQIFNRELLGLYTQDAAAIDAGCYRLRLVCGFYFICGMMDTAAYVMRGMGYSILPVAICLGGALGLRMIWLATLFQTPRFHTLFWLYMTYPVSWLATFLTLLVVLYFILRKRLKESMPR